MKKFRLILHGALNGTAQGRADLIVRLEEGLGLSRETAEILMADLPRVIREDLTESEASDLSFELESLGALVETEEHEVLDASAEVATDLPHQSPVEEAVSIPLPITEESIDAAPLFEVPSNELPALEVESLLEQAVHSIEEAAPPQETSPSAEPISVEAPTSLEMPTLMELSLDEPESPPSSEPLTKGPASLAETIHQNLSSLDIPAVEEPLEIGFDTEQSAPEEKPRVVGFFDDTPPAETFPVPPPPVYTPPAPKQEASTEAPAASNAFAPPPVMPATPKQAAPRNRLVPIIAVGAAVAIAALAGFVALNQPEPEPTIKITTNVDALLQDQKKILSDEAPILPQVKTLRSWSRDFVQEEYQGRLVVDELPDGNARVRINMKFLKPRRPSKEDLALGRGSSEWLTSIQGDLQSKSERVAGTIELPVNGSVNGYLQGISISSRKQVQISGKFMVDEKASQVTARVDIKVKLKNLSPTAKTVQEPYSDHTQTLVVE